MLGGAVGGGGSGWSVGCAYQRCAVHVGCVWVMMLRHRRCLARGRGRMTPLSSTDTPCCAHPPSRGRAAGGGGGRGGAMAQQCRAEAVHGVAKQATCGEAGPGEQWTMEEWTL